MPPRKPCIERKAEPAIDDGGPAFPVLYGQTNGLDGMSLRDWFAGQALIGFADLVSHKFPDQTMKVIAERSYQMADAMIAAREKPE